MDNSIPPLKERIKALRKSAGWNQTEFAIACKVTQGQVSLWEKGVNVPTPKVFLIFAKLAPEADKQMWMAEAGFEETAAASMVEMLQIPVLRDSAAAGTTRSIDESEIDYVLQLPKHLVRHRGKLIGLEVEGDSMSPILESGYIVLVDTATRRPESLDGKMVAARDGDGVTIKWLRRQNADMYLLVPQHTSPRHQVQVLQAHGDWSIVGEVVKWIGEPPPPPKKR